MWTDDSLRMDLWLSGGEKSIGLCVLGKSTMCIGWGGGDGTELMYRGICPIVKYPSHSVTVYTKKTLEVCRSGRCPYDPPPGSPRRLLSSSPPPSPLRLQLEHDKGYSGPTRLSETRVYFITFLVCMQHMTLAYQVVTAQLLSLSPPSPLSLACPGLHTYISLSSQCLIFASYREPRPPPPKD